MEVYADTQIRGILQELGIRITSQTNKNYLALCPFHNNQDTSSFSVSRTTGQFICYNPACGQHGGLHKLIMKLSDKNFNQASRMLRTAEVEIDYYSEIQQRMEAKEMEEFSQEALDRLRETFWKVDAGLDYMKGRGFTEDTLQHFDVGYSEAQHMVIVPMHDFRGTPVGLVGRSVTGKSFKNSTGLPKNETFWNLHRVRKYDHVIITESIFDAMMLHQCGFPNSVALLGGTFADEHKQLLNRYFEEFTVASDADAGGRMLANKIGQALRHKIVRDVRFPPGTKDVGDVYNLAGEQGVNSLVNEARSKLEQQLMV